MSREDGHCHGIGGRQRRPRVGWGDALSYARQPVSARRRRSSIMAGWAEPPPSRRTGSPTPPRSSTLVCIAPAHPAAATPARGRRCAGPRPGYPPSAVPPRPARPRSGGTVRVGRGGLGRRLGATALDGHGEANPAASVCEPAGTASPTAVDPPKVTLPLPMCFPIQHLGSGAIARWPVAVEFAGGAGD